MSKERELLNKVLSEWDEFYHVSYDTLMQISAYLAEPVGKTDKFIRLSEDEVAALRYRFSTNEIVTSYELICATENKLAEKNGEAA